MSDPNKHPFDDIFPDDPDGDSVPPDDAGQADAESSDDESPESNGPQSDAPPRVVAEAPLGGVSRPIVMPSEPEPSSPASDAPADAARADVPSSEPAAPPTPGSEDAEDVPDADDAEDVPLTPSVPATEPGEQRADDKPQSAGDAPPPVSDSVTPATADVAGPPSEPPPESDLSPEAQIQARLKKLQARKSGESADSGAPEPDRAAEDDTSRSAVTSPAPRKPQPESPPEKQPVSSAEAGGLGDAQEWDEDLSPELAAVLFGGPSADAKPAERAPADTVPAADDDPTDTAEPDAEAPSLATAPSGADAVQPAPDEATTPAAASPAEPAAEPEPDAPPIELTDLAEVRTLPLTAERRAAPAPDVAIQGRARYVRVEEPLGEDAGQRTFETWEYLKPAYATLNGREVREVTIEDVQHGDGSRLWRYERRYGDRGRDSREVRVNADATYIEREDVVSRLDAAGRRLQFKETAELIYAAPDTPEKKGGLLSGLGNLLGRDDEDEAQVGPQVWRQATASEVRQARKQGGEAFRRGLLDGLIG